MIARMDVSSNARAVARELTRIWGAKPKVFRHGDETESHYIPVAHCLNTPVDGVASVGTIGLSDHDLGLGSVRVELVGAFPASFEQAPNVVATCAFNAFKSGWPTRPDAIHADVVRMYRPGATVPHVLLTDPFLWDDGPVILDLDDFKVAWLMMVPISESERRFAETNGASALTEMFEQSNIDIFDLERDSVV